jgi:predicted DNA-binding protein with PD1-like motif
MELDFIKNLFSKYKKIENKEDLINQLKKFYQKNNIKNNEIFEKIDSYFDSLKKFSKNEIDQIENIFDMFEFDKVKSEKDIYKQLKSWVNLYFKIKLDDIKLKDNELFSQIENLIEKEDINITKNLKLSLKEWFKEEIYEKEKLIQLNNLKEKIYNLNQYELILLFFIISYCKNPYIFLEI